jgi:YidC/Oxa1 family membrane protein insertase
VDKRLPLALFLSFLVLLLWSQTLGRPTDVPPTQEGAVRSDLPARPRDPAAQTPAEAAQAARAELPVLGERVGEDKELTLDLDVGLPGQPGSFWARFSNRGASLRELRLGNFFDKELLPESERSDRQHWVKLIESSPESAATGSMLLRTGPSSRSYEREALEQALWSMREVRAEDDPRGWPGVVFELAQGSGLRFEKRFAFEPDSYRVHVTLGLSNTGLEPSAFDTVLNFFFTPAEMVPREAGDEYYTEPQAACAGQTAASLSEGGLPRFDTKPRDEQGGVREGKFDVPGEITRFAGVHNKYFAVLLRAADDTAAHNRSQASLRGARWRCVRDEAWARENPGDADEAWRYIASDLLLELRIPAPGETATWDYVVFAGPKDRELLVDDNPAHAVLVEEDLGFFNNIARALLAVLGFFHGLTGNWGVAIILLTLAARVLLFPLNRRSQTAMARHAAKMKRLQPKIDELKQRHAGDPAKQRQAQAELMQKEGLFPPLGGCLPMFVQLPIFFGLYQALRTSFELRQAPFFGWIKDLSKPDRLLPLNLHTGLPFIGTIEYLNILPPLMVVLWIAQQATMPKPADEQAAKMQRMMMFMPAVMGVFLYNYAAGLSLYMITQSALGIVEQHVIKRLWPLDDKEPERKPKGGFMSRMMERAQAMQREAEARQKRGGGGGGGGRKGSGKRR